MIHIDLSNYPFRTNISIIVPAECFIGEERTLYDYVSSERKVFWTSDTFHYRKRSYFYYSRIPRTFVTKELSESDYQT